MRGPNARTGGSRDATAGAPGGSLASPDEHPDPLGGSVAPPDGHSDPLGGGDPSQGHADPLGGSVDAHLEELGGSVSPAALEPPAPAPPGPPSVQTGPRYQERGLLGAGGMGRVTLVRDTVLQRDVAMKTLPAQADSPSLGRRLMREALLTAGLEHPHIVPVYDAQTDPERGAPWYTMRVVRGRSLAAILRETKRPEDRLRLLRHLLAAAQGVAWAHRHGVIHRDLKPDNIMVGELGEAQVVDWGLARRIGEAPDGPLESSPGDALTLAGGALGTPQYMSPEQARGEPADARSDVWSLGLVLHELVTGEPVRPRAQAELALAHARRATPPSLAGLPPELGAIVARATAGDPAARYPDASAFADDLASWLDGRRVAAHSYTPRELLFRLVRAWRVPLIVAAVALVALGVAIALGYTQTLRERDRATAAEARAKRSESEARDALARAEAELTRTLTTAARDLAQDLHLPEAELTAAEALRHGESALARGLLMTLAASPRPTLVASYRLPPCQRLDVSADLGHFTCQDPDALSAWRLGPAPHMELAWRRTGRVVDAVIFDRQGKVVLSDAPPGRLVVELPTGKPLAERDWCCGPLFASPGGALVYARTQLTLELLSGMALTSRRVEDLCDDLVVASTVDDDGRFVATCADGTYAWGVADDHDSETLRGDDARAFRFAVALVPGRAEAVFGSNDGRVALIDLASGERRFERSGAVGLVAGLRVSPDGEVVAMIDGVAGVLVLDLVTGQWVTRLPMPESLGARFIAGHPRRLATWGRERLTVWDLPSARPAQFPAGGGVASLEVSDTVYIGTGEGLDRVDARGRLVHREPVLGVVKAVVEGPGVLALGIARYDHGLELRTEAGERLRLDGFTRHLVSLTSTHFVRGRDYGPLELLTWDGAALLLLPGQHDSRDMEKSADGRHVAWLDGDGQAWVLTAGEPPWLDLVSIDPSWVSIAPDRHATRVAGARRDTIEVMDRDGVLLAIHVGGDGADLREVAWSPDDQLLAAAGLRDGKVRLWRLGEALPRAILDAHGSQVPVLVFAGDQLVTGSWDHTVRWSSLAPFDATSDTLVGRAEKAWGRSYQDLAAPGAP